MKLLGHHGHWRQTFWLGVLKDPILGLSFQTRSRAYKRSPLTHRVYFWTCLDILSGKKHGTGLWFCHIMFIFLVFFPWSNVLWIHLPFSAMKHQEVWVRDQLLVITATGDTPVDCELSPSCPESVLDTTRHSQWFNRKCSGVLCSMCSWIEHAGYKSPEIVIRSFWRIICLLEIDWKWEGFKRDPRLQGRPMSSGRHNPAASELIGPELIQMCCYRCYPCDANGCGLRSLQLNAQGEDCGLEWPHEDSACSAVVIICVTYCPFLVHG
jgi:hypothetical protein